MKTEDMNSKDVLKLLQQKIGNLELTVHALLQALEEEGIVDNEQVNEQAQDIVEQMQEVELEHEEIDTDQP